MDFIDPVDVNVRNLEGWSAAEYIMDIQEFQWSPPGDWKKCYKDAWEEMLSLWTILKLDKKNRDEYDISWYC